MHTPSFDAAASVKAMTGAITAAGSLLPALAAMTMLDEALFALPLEGVIDAV